MLTSAGGVLEVCWRCAGVAPLQHAPMSDPSSTTPTPLRHTPPGTLISRRRGVCAAPLLALGGADALPLFSPVDALRDKMTERGAPDACRRSKTQNILAPVGFEPTPANGLEP